MVRRVYVEKKKGFDVEACGLLERLKSSLDLPRLTEIRVLNRYDVEDIDEETYRIAKRTVFSEPAIDKLYDEELPEDLFSVFFAVEYLPGQYDQRADSAVQCIKMINAAADVTVNCARIIALGGEVTEKETAEIKKYCINPVDSREAVFAKPSTLKPDYIRPGDVKTVNGFTTLTTEELSAFRETSGFAMSDGDIAFVRQYFAEKEKRDPTVTELAVIDTYWSDHCRHTTFLTNLTDIQFEAGTEVISEVFEEYKAMQSEVYGDGEKAVCLMDIACIGAKYLKKKGLLNDLDESDEINACSIKIKADVDGKEEDWLVMFKNETHNHPTEIEPFGGAATCLGGAIRDPLSGRAYVYQAMRVTGSGDPRRATSDTLQGKLPQRKITQEAALGYSQYGNQIGLATGQVAEIYDEGYVAKRMEIGAVIGAAPASHVRREKPKAGDIIILVGGRTGRDGCGGATGSSKAHTEESVQSCGAEVQKGNPPVERNIQRLFRRKEAAKLIKKCNDFGAGGVSVAIGELADGIDVNLDLIPKKYEGLDGTELAISESQERMAVVVAAADKDAFTALAKEENLEATAAAIVTDTGRFRMFWRGKTILDLSRAFLDTNGAAQKAKARVTSFGFPEKARDKNFLGRLEDLNCCSRKGLIEKFDSTIGAATVLMPLGGKHQLSPALGMAAKLPLARGETNTATLMTYGFDPKISKESPFHGALSAVLESVTKIAAMGGDISKIRLTFQEYFEKMKTPESWGKPLAALLGALKAQKELGIPAIGGKDSMSGSFMDLSVPPTLVSFAVAVCRADKIISTEFKKVNSKIVMLRTDYDENGLPDFAMYKKSMSRLSSLAENHKILAANTVGSGGIFVALVKMAVGNKIGFKIKRIEEEILFDADYTAVILEAAEDASLETMFGGIPYEELGVTTKDGTFVSEGIFSIALEPAIAKWETPLERIFPVRTSDYKREKDATKIETFTYDVHGNRFPKIKIAKPRVLIPVFPGTNCEMDSGRAFERAGAEVRFHITRNLDKETLIQSIDELAEKIKESQIIMLPGGFSGGDEPDGSAKFITAVFRNAKIKEAVTEFLENRDGLMLGICNGFQALIKLGLVPYGKLVPQDENSPTLTYNKIGGHISRLVRTRVASVKSPWFAKTEVGDIHTVAVSHGEGRFAAGGELIAKLAENGQIAAQYVNFFGKASMDISFNPNYSASAIEAITSPDGRILGKMAHSERIGKDLYKNVPGNYDQKIFESGVAYFND